MAPPCFRLRLRTLLLATTIVAALLAIGSIIKPELLLAATSVGMFAILLIGPQWVLVRRSNVPDELVPNTRLLLGALSFGPGSLATTLASMWGAHLIGRDSFYQLIGGVMLACLAMHVLAAVLFLFAIIGQTHDRRAASPLLNMLCATYPILILPPAYFVIVCSTL